MVTIVVLNNILKHRLGYGDPSVYFIKCPESNMLEFIVGDEILLDVMAKTLKTKWEVSVFCDHLINGQCSQSVTINDSQLVVIMLQDQHEVDADDHPEDMEDQTQDKFPTSSKDNVED